MLAFDVSQLVRSPVFFRGPAIFQDVTLTSFMDEKAICVFDPIYIGSELYFHFTPISSYKWLLSNYNQLTNPPIIQSNQTKKVLKYILKLVRKHTNLTIQVEASSVASTSPFEIIPASEIDTLVSFFQSDPVWKLRLPKTKKCLFLFDLSFFDILRNHNDYNGGEAPRHITTHIENTTCATSQAHLILCPTAYLKNEIPKYFNLQIGAKIRNIPLCSTQIPPEIQSIPADLTKKNIVSSTDKSSNLAFKRRRFVIKSKVARQQQKKPIKISSENRKFKLILVSGFDGFKNDNKGIGNLLDLMRLQKLLFPNGRRFHLTLVCPPHIELSDRIDSLDLTSDTEHVSFLSKEALAKRLVDSDALIVTSIDEGFCLPVQEAALLKVPVIATEIPSLKELWGTSIGYIDPWNRYKAASQLQSIPSGDINEAYRRAKNYSPENLKNKLFEAISDITRV